MKEQVFPDLLDIMRKRFEILQTISVYQPIGRRGISNQTGYSERFIRNEIDQLENLNLIQVTTKGVIILEKGKNVLDELFDYMNELSGLLFLEEKLQQALNLKKAIIVSGNSDEDEYIKIKLRQATVSYLKKTIQKDITIKSE